MTKTFSVAILGLGNIGMLYDYDDDGHENFLSHTKSFNHHPSFNITYLIDKDVKKLQLAKQKYAGNTKYIESVDEIEEMPDVFVLASIPSVNLSVFNQLKDHPQIKLFLIEKPFWSPEMKFEDYAKYSEKCVLNYPRKFISFYQELKDGIDKLDYGKAIAAQIWYSKGTRNNGSHLIDLMNYLFGHETKLGDIHVFNKTIDYIEQDPTYSFSTKYNHNGEPFPVVFQALNEKVFSLIEMDLFFEQKRFRIFDFGEKVEIYAVDQDPIYKDYKNLISQEVISTNMNTYGLGVCNEVFEILHNNKKSISSLENEHQIFKVINKIKN
jgi:hypothetical protein